MKYVRQRKKKHNKRTKQKKQTKEPNKRTKQKKETQRIEK